jgi:hypothetical protein
MSGTLVYVKFAEKVREVILEMYPHLQEFVGSNKVLYCRLKKALYGCVQAFKLWYEKLQKFLQVQGYKRCDIDPCVFKREVGNKVYLPLVYVDDIHIVADTEVIERLEREFVSVFKWITMSVRPSHSNMGMQISVRNETVTLDMCYYLGKILECCDTPKATAVTPGGTDTFLVDGASRLLAEAGKKWFHMLVAKLLYLSKWARPDIIAVVGFLCTRVKSPTEEDEKKLGRC